MKLTLFSWLRLSWAMGVAHHLHPRLLISLTFLLSFLVSASAITTLSSFLGEEERKERTEVPSDSSAWERVVNRRRLNGPGSSPPTCRSKCGGCSPCRPVHVTIQPGLSRPLEYYPEAWRCKCGNTLFMP